MTAGKNPFTYLALKYTFASFAELVGAASAMHTYRAKGYKAPTRELVEAFGPFARWACGLGALDGVTGPISHRFYGVDSFGEGMHMLAHGDPGVLSQSAKLKRDVSRMIPMGGSLMRQRCYGDVGDDLDTDRLRLKPESPWLSKRRSKLVRGAGDRVRMIVIDSLSSGAVSSSEYKRQAALVCSLAETLRKRGMIVPVYAFYAMGPYEDANYSSPSIADGAINVGGGFAIGKRDFLAPLDPTGTGSLPILSARAGPFVSRMFGVHLLSRLGIPSRAAASNPELAKLVAESSLNPSAQDGLMSYVQSVTRFRVEECMPPSMRGHPIIIIPPRVGQSEETVKGWVESNRLLLS